VPPADKPVFQFTPQPRTTLRCQPNFQVWHKMGGGCPKLGPSLRSLVCIPACIIVNHPTVRPPEAATTSAAGALRSWAIWLPWAWPREREALEGAGIALAKQYEAQELNMLLQHAQFEDKSISVEAGLLDMLTRMEAGRFKVFSELKDWFEFRLYHRKDGRVHKEHDDLMSATRYGVMMLRFAEVPNRPALDMGRRARAGSSNWLAI
jgi:Terminase RNaseH-like domain